MPNSKPENKKNLISVAHQKFWSNPWAAKSLNTALTVTVVDK